MFTSGTTGRPKGVDGDYHANVKTFLRWAIPAFSIGPGDRMSNHSAVAFDLSVFEPSSAPFSREPRPVRS